MFWAKYAKVISMDHDLGLKELTGYDLLNELEAKFRKDEVWTAGMPEIRVHSANPVGAERTKSMITTMPKYEESLS